MSCINQSLAEIVLVTKEDKHVSHSSSDKSGMSFFHLSRVFSSFFVGAMDKWKYREDMGFIYDLGGK